MRTKTRVFCSPISVARWEEKGGGFDIDQSEQTEHTLNVFLKDLDDACYIVRDIKVNHFTMKRHNNGGCDEVWVQYTVVYEGDY